MDLKLDYRLIGGGGERVERLDVLTIEVSDDPIDVQVVDGLPST